MNPGITVRLLGMAQLASQHDGWVNLNRLDVSSPGAQSRRDVIAGSGADNRDVRQRATDFVREVIICAKLAPLGIPCIREIVYSLIVVACRPNQRQARILTTPNFQ
jgi:hypothetical protein